MGGRSFQNAKGGGGGWSQKWKKSKLTYRLFFSFLQLFIKPKSGKSQFELTYKTSFFFSLHNYKEKINISW